MDATFEKIDAIRKRTHATYRIAKEALEQAGGSVNAAVASILDGRSATEVLRVGGEDLLKVLATIVRRGNASRIIVKNGDFVVADIPVTVGVASAVMAPWLTLLATMALLVSSWTLEVERPAAPVREPVIP